MNLLITGISSFIGRHLAASLHARGHRICGTARRPLEGLYFLEKQSLVNLSQPFDPEIFSHQDGVVHLAHDFRTGQQAVNIQGTRNLERAAAQKGVFRQLFLSSYSARPDALSEYGKTKFELEMYFLDQGHAVARPGLVIGAGGLSARMAAVVERFPIVPAPGGDGALPFISRPALSTAIGRIMEYPWQSGAQYNLFAPQFTTLATLLREIKAAQGGRLRLLPIPPRFLLWGMGMVEKAGLRLPVNTGNLIGFLTNQQQCHFSNMDQLPGGPMEPETLRQAVANWLPQPTTTG